MGGIVAQWECKANCQAPQGLLWEDRLRRRLLSTVNRCSAAMNGVLTKLAGRIMMFGIGDALIR